jgi:hypothetical protein
MRRRNLQFSLPKPGGGRKGRRLSVADHELYQQPEKSPLLLTPS